MEEKSHFLQITLQAHFFRTINFQDKN